ncbi:adenylylsulfate kinase [Oxalobacteraceae bacterium GrIS 1.11]
MDTEALIDELEVGGKRPRTMPILDRRQGGRSANTFWHAGKVSPERREERFGHIPSTIWMTGLSGAGKSTIAYELEQLLHQEGRSSYVLDGDNLRHRLNRDLGFAPADRRENIRRTAEVARMMNEAGLMVIAAFISPYRDDRAMAAEIIGASAFVEVYVSTPAALCEERDPKGLYVKARSGEIPAFTGISAPYEVPLNPALVLDTGVLDLAGATRALYQHLALRFK